MAMNHVEHFIFEIKHYNKVLNGNRSYVSGIRDVPLFSASALTLDISIP